MKYLYAFILAILIFPAIISGQGNEITSAKSKVFEIVYEYYMPEIPDFFTTNERFKFLADKLYNDIHLDISKLRIPIYQTTGIMVDARGYLLTNSSILKAQNDSSIENDIYEYFADLIAHETRLKSFSTDELFELASQLKYNVGAYFKKHLVVYDSEYNSYSIDRFFHSRNFPDLILIKCKENLKKNKIVKFEYPSLEDAIFTIGSPSSGILESTFFNRGLTFRKLKIQPSNFTKYAELFSIYYEDNNETWGGAVFNSLGECIGFLSQTEANQFTEYPMLSINSIKNLIKLADSSPFKNWFSLEDSGIVFNESELSEIVIVPSFKGSSILIDGIDYGGNFPRAVLLTPGDHTFLEVNSDEYYSFQEKSIHITLGLNPQLTLTSQEKISVAIKMKSLRRDISFIFDDGKTTLEFKGTDDIRIFPGTYTFSISEIDSQFFPKKTVQIDKQNSVINLEDLNLIANLKLINAIPAANVWVDGSIVQIDENSEISLLYGVHKIDIINGDFEPLMGSIVTVNTPELTPITLSQELNYRIRSGWKFWVGLPLSAFTLYSTYQFLSGYKPQSVRDASLIIGINLGAILLEGFALSEILQHTEQEKYFKDLGRSGGF